MEQPYFPRVGYALSRGVWYTRGMERDVYPREVPDDEWAFVAPTLSLMREDAPQQEHASRE